jgi:hypothetical protein
MKTKHIFFSALVVSLVAILMAAGQVGAGSEGKLPPGSEATISGPEIWGVVVLDCSRDMATLRVKRINNCDVETEAVMVPWVTCPVTAADPVNVYLDGVNLTSMGIAQTPIITKVKNFEIQGNIASFDVQIRSTSYMP